MHDPYGGFEYAAWEARRELLEEARKWRLVRMVRSRRSLRERVAPAFRLFAGWWERVRPPVAAKGVEVVVGEVPDLAYLTPESSEEPGTAVEVYLGAGGCVVRKTDLRTGASTDAFVADGKVKR